MARAKASGQSTAAATRLPVIMQKKAEGWSFRDIGELLGLTHQTVHAQFWAERARLRADSQEHSAEIDAIRDDQAERMRQIIKAWLPRAVGTERDKDGFAVLDRDAAAIVLKCDERLSKLHGLDAPAKSDITSNGQTIAGAPGLVMDLSSYTADELAALEAIHRSAIARNQAAEDGGLPGLPAP